jgi:hypothetical protein
MIGIEDKLMNVEGHLREISLLRRLLWGRQPSFFVDWIGALSYLDNFGSVRSDT